MFDRVGDGYELDIVESCGDTGVDPAQVASSDNGNA